MQTLVLSPVTSSLQRIRGGLPSSLCLPAVHPTDCHTYSSFRSRAIECWCIIRAAHHAWPHQTSLLGVSRPWSASFIYFSPSLPAAPPRSWSSHSELLPLSYPVTAVRFAVRQSSPAILISSGSYSSIIVAVAVGEVI